MKLHTIELIETPKGTPLIRRVAVCGGWLYYICEDTELAPVFVADPAAEHCRQRVPVRVFKLRDGYTVVVDGAEVWKDGSGRWTVMREDGIYEVIYAEWAKSHHGTMAEAHDALGPDSPWVEVMP